MLWKLLCLVQLLGATLVETPLVVLLMPPGHPHGRLHRVRTAPTLMLPLLVPLSMLIILLTTPWRLRLGYLMTCIMVPLLLPLFPSPWCGTTTSPVSMPVGETSA